MHNNQFLYKSYRAWIGTVLAVALVFVPVNADAATLALSPASTKVSVGNIVSVTLSLNTAGVAINNAESVVQFPSDLLEVVSLSKNSSIFSLWVEEPTFSNTAGTVSLNGGVANPGFNGSSGTLATIIFKAKKSGTATVVFADGAVRANDGLGTNVLTSKSGSTIEIAPPKEIMPVMPAVPTTSAIITVPAATTLTPTITSDTHPEQHVWYSNSTATFSWKVPKGVTGLLAELNKTDGSTPKISYDRSVTQKTLTGLSDGTYYFHVRYKVGTALGPVNTYRINVDTTAPPSFVPTLRTDAKQQYLSLNAEDALSGISRYTLRIDDKSDIAIDVSTLINGEYHLPVLVDGTHNIVVTAYDNAGNSTSEHVAYISPYISSPVFESSADNIHKGEQVTISGTSEYPGAQVAIVLEVNGIEIKTYLETVSADGTFSITTDALQKVGTVTVTAKNVFSESVYSPFSEKLQFIVRETDVARISIAIVWVIGAAISVFILLLLLYIGWRKFLLLRAKTKHGLEQAIADAHTATTMLKAELVDQLMTLEKKRVDRNLNNEEERIFKEIEKNIDDIDKFIEKKLKKML